MKTSILKPNMTLPTVASASTPRKLLAVPVPLPPRQPLPSALIDRSKPMLKLGLDVHLEFIMAVVQRGHLGPQAPRKFTRPELVEQVQRWSAEGLQVFAVQESCGFGFVLHRQLVEAGAQSFLITPVVLNGKRKTDKFDARALCLRLSRWLEGNGEELAPYSHPHRGGTTPARNHPPPAVPQTADSRPGQPRPWASGRVLPSKAAPSLVGSPSLEKAFHDAGCLAAGRSE